MMLVLSAVAVIFTIILYAGVVVGAVALAVVYCLMSLLLLIKAR